MTAKSQFQMETLHTLCSNRKSQNFQTLKQWDQSRAHHLTTHRKIVDEIEQNLQTRICESDEFMRVVVQYLSDVDNQLKKQEIQTVSNPQTKLMSNLISRSIQTDTSKTLIKLYNQTQPPKISKKMRSLLEECINKIQLILTESNKDIMELKTKIQLQILQIQNQNGITFEKCELVNHTHNNKDKLNKIFHQENDLFLIQQQFLQQSLHQTNAQQQLGHLIVELLHCAEKYEKAKLETVRESLENYLVALEEDSLTNENVKALHDILEKRTENEILSAFYSSEEFITADTMRDLRRASPRLQHNTIDLGVLKQFLTLIPYHPFNSRNLILKQYRIQLKTAEELESSYLIITVDAFLHIYQYLDNFSPSEQQPLFTLKCNHTLQMKPEGNASLSLEVKKWQLGKQPDAPICVAFLTEDQREEFSEFVGKIVE